MIEENFDIRKESEELLERVQKYVKDVNELHKKVMKSKFLKLTFNINKKPVIEEDKDFDINKFLGERDEKAK